MLLFSKKKHSLIAYFPVILLVITLGAFVYFSNSVSVDNLDKEKELLQTALDRSILQCYALEGSYPSSLGYLEEHYGLTYNKELFFIDYQYIGDNLRPDITIIERD